MQTFAELSENCWPNCCRSFWGKPNLELCKKCRCGRSRRMLGNKKERTLAPRGVDTAEKESPKYWPLRVNTNRLLIVRVILKCLICFCFFRMRFHAKAEIPADPLPVELACMCSRAVWRSEGFTLAPPLTK